jgi:diacylglycerol kinase (ATP)
MRILAFHNPTAGSQEHDGEELAERLRGCGHEVVRVVRHQPELERALREEACDLIVAAGGDGTVNKAARAARGTTIPVAIVPLGTANNMARATGVTGEPAAIMQRWPAFIRRSFDAAVATWTVEVADDVRAPLARRHVFECFGYGAFCQSMATASAGHTAEPSADAGEKLARDRRTFVESVETAPVRDYRIDLDGVDCSGAYLMVEMMLIPFLGPRVELVPEGGRSDGRVEVVLVGEAEREGLLRHLRDDTSRADRFAWRTRPLRGSCVTIEAGDARAHADGKLCAGEDGEPLVGPVRIEVTANAYEMFVPDGRSATSS